MKKINLAFAVVVFPFLAFQGCASSSLNRKVDSEVSQETAIKTHADLQNETVQLIETASGLSPEQRSKLTKLRNTTRMQLDAMWIQSLKLRSVLIKDLVATDYNEEEVNLIKLRIKSLEDKRLSLTFSAIEEANQILGHETEVNRQRIMEKFLEGHGGGRD